MPFNIEENPLYKTPGLTSSIQLLDTTNEITYSNYNYTSQTYPFSSTLLKPLNIAPNLEKQRFKESLRKAITKNINLLKELSKY